MKRVLWKLFRKVRRQFRFVSAEVKTIVEYIFKYKGKEHYQVCRNKQKILRIMRGSYEKMQENLSSMKIESPSVEEFEAARAKARPTKLEEEK